MAGHGGTDDAQGSKRDVRPRGGRDERRGGFVRRVGSHTATAHSLRCVRLARDGAVPPRWHAVPMEAICEGWPCDDGPSAGEARRCGSRAGLPGGHRAALDRTRRRRTTNGRTGAAYHAPSQAVTHAITACDGRAAQGGRVRIQAPLACHAAPCSCGPIIGPSAIDPRPVRAIGLRCEWRRRVGGRHVGRAAWRWAHVGVS
jgi:hypothetical protein